MRLRLKTLTVTMLCTLAVAAQTTSIKNNLLYDATLTPNLGIETKVGNRSTIQLFYGLNPWNGYHGMKKLQHWSLMPEYRYWLQEKGPFQGWFTGIHALGGEYNVGGIKLPFNLFKQLEYSHYEGWYAGGGLTIGHAWRLSEHWRLEAALGLGYIHTKYKRYENEVCGAFLDCGRYNYVGPTKLALNIAYAFGGKKPEPVPEIPEIPEVPAPPTFTLAYITPQAEPEKARALSGQAYLDFQVNKTNILPDYRNNQRELGKVIETINTVKSDPNITISHISIHGYASPEGSYQSNARLAEGRAQAFRDYIGSLIDLPATVFSVTSTPEDWDGLVARLADGTVASDLQSDAIQTIARDTTITPDERERQLRTRYPAEWKHLLTNVFPSLRHSDYTVNYTIRPFSVEEARDIIRTKPQQLSLNEMFLVANTYAPGSQDFNDVFETAVRMYPDDPTANLNAAVIALQKNDLTAATRYLEKAGSSPEAELARIALNAKQENPDTIIQTEN